MKPGNYLNISANGQGMLEGRNAIVGMIVITGTRELHVPERQWKTAALNRIMWIIAWQEFGMNQNIWCLKYYCFPTSSIWTTRLCQVALKRCKIDQLIERITQHWRNNILLLIPFQTHLSVQSRHSLVLLKSKNTLWGNCCKILGLVSYMTFKNALELLSPSW